MLFINVNVNQIKKKVLYLSSICTSFYFTYMCEIKAILKAKLIGKKSVLLKLAPFYCCYDSWPSSPLRDCINLLCNGTLRERGIEWKIKMGRENQIFILSFFFVSLFFTIKKKCVLLVNKSILLNSMGHLYVDQKLCGTGLNF